MARRRSAEARLRAAAVQIGRQKGDGTPTAPPALSWDAWQKRDAAGADAVALGCVPARRLFQPPAPRVGGERPRPAALATKN